MTLSDLLPPPLQPLRRKLPTLIIVLLGAVVVSFSWIAHRHLMRAFTSAAGRHMASAAQQVVGLIEESVLADRHRVATAAMDASFIRVLRRADAGTPGDAIPSIAEPLRVGESAPLRTLWTTRCVTVFSARGTTRDSARVPCPGAAELRANAGTQGWARPMVLHGDTLQIEMVAAVVVGRDTLGFLAERRGLGGSQGIDALKALIGLNSRLFVGNASGSPLWTDFTGRVAPPPSIATDVPVELATDSGRRDLAVAIPVRGTPWLLYVDLPLEPALAEARSATEALLALALLAIFVGAVGAWAISAHVTRPLAELTKAATALARGDYARRVSSAHHGEIGSLMASFNYMASEVEAARTQRLAHAQELELQVQQAQDLAQELEVSNQELLEAMEETTEARRESQLMEAKLLRSQKMEAVGRLAGGVAHDFNNLLTVITSYSAMALETVAGEDPLYADIEEILAASRRATTLTQQLLAFSRNQVLQPTIVNLNDVAREVQRMLERLIGEDVRLTLQLADDVGAVCADRGQLEQVLMNLAINARDAMPDGGSLVISTANVERAGASSHVAEDGAATPLVMLQVTDSGTGMTEDTRAHLFEPFFTTKPVGKGTGLGLATVYGIVTQSGGELHVQSLVGAGSTFTIYLPRVQGIEIGAARKTPARGMPTVGSGTLLLVEDDTALRQLACRVLLGHGYDVIQAGSAADALRITAANARSIDLLLTDVVMPGMNGRALAERLREDHPALRVLFMSGYTDDDVMRRGVRAAEASFLPKPFTPSVLLAAVKAALVD